mgnify:CR=1 FL=1
MMGRTIHRRSLVVPLIGIMLLFLGAGCGNALSRLGLGPEPTATPPPTATPTPRPTATPTPVATLLVPTRPSEGNGLGIPAEPNAPFTVTMTDDELNEYLAEREFSQSGVQVSDVEVTITADEMIVNLFATQAESGLSGEVTVRGVPQVVDGQVYFLVGDVTLGESIRGFGRLLAQAAIDQALRQYAEEDGIPVPVEEAEIQEIALEPGAITVTGVTR